MNLTAKLSVLKILICNTKYSTEAVNNLIAVFKKKKKKIMENTLQI